MKVTITIETGNEACENMEDVAWCLKELAHRIQTGQTPSKVMDANGQSVGTVEIED